jgi:hypothetical protein
MGQRQILEMTHHPIRAFVVAAAAIRVAGQEKFRHDEGATGGPSCVSLYNARWQRVIAHAE